jgi:hypothetical protein
VHTSDDQRNTHHLVASADENGHRARVGTLLDDEHLLLGGAERELADEASVAKLVGAQVLETGDDAAVGRNGDQLDLGATNPADGREVVLHEEVVGLIVKAPLANDEVGAGVLDSASVSSRAMNYLSDNRPC